MRDGVADGTGWPMSYWCADARSGFGDLRDTIAVLVGDG
jgi:hypothetical protein